MIIAVGSRGHVDPCTGLGVRIAQAGHRVTIAADNAFAGLVRTAGLGFRALPGDLRRHLAPPPAGDQGVDQVTRGRIDAARRISAYMREVNLGTGGLAADADILLAGEMGMAAYHVAQARGIPCVGIHLAPTHVVASGEVTVDKAGSHLLRSGERLYFAGINELRAQYGLPPTTVKGMFREQYGRAWPICYGFSRHAVPRPSAWREGLDIVGYWWPYRDPAWVPPPRLADFLDNGPPPVFVGFGSMVTHDALQVSKVIESALRRINRRGVIQPGWAGLSVTGDDMFVVDDVPYDWLFPQMAAIVHSAGAGITGAGLRAGVPAVPVPHTSPDQIFWAERLMALGVSPKRSLRLGRLSADDLADAIQSAVAEPHYGYRAAALAHRIGNEDGSARVVELVKQLG